MNATPGYNFYDLWLVFHIIILSCQFVATSIGWLESLVPNLRELLADLISMKVVAPPSWRLNWRMWKVDSVNLGFGARS